MTITVAPGEKALFDTLRSFLTGILPVGVEIVRAQGNRVPEPRVQDFVVMTILRQTRIETNIDEDADASFIGSIAGNTMMVTSMAMGSIAVGRQIFGTDVDPATQVTSGSGGIGSYGVTPAQNISSRKLAAGVSEKLQPTMVTFQFDVHGPASADNAQIISMLMNDEFAAERFFELNPEISPLFADDPRQMPFINDQNQYETRWVVEVSLQNNSRLSIPQQYADELTVDLVSVDAAYSA